MGRRPGQSAPQGECCEERGRLFGGRRGHAEHTGLFFEAANGTKFVGNPTQGANGDVTNLSLPGGIYVHFSGQGVWHADGRQLQRLGLQPDVEAHPTLAGIRAGKDEVLDKAVQYVAQALKAQAKK